MGDFRAPNTVFFAPSLFILQEKGGPVPMRFATHDCIM